MSVARFIAKCLQAELGIGVLGHREALMEAIKALPQISSSSSAPLVSSESPESPLLRAKAHRLKLLRELEKAQGHAATLKRYTHSFSHLEHSMSNLEQAWLTEV